MTLRSCIVSKLCQSTLGERLVHNQDERAMFIATVSLSFNLCYALFHGIWGAMQQSIWLLTLCAYYCILGTTRFAAVLCEQKNKELEWFVLKVCGVLLVLLSFVLGAITYLSISESIATKHSTILMITIATYVTIKVTMAILRAVRHQGSRSPLYTALRCISYADVAVSLMTMQSSMLASFGTIADLSAFILNVLTGTAVWLFILFLGLYMIRKEQQNGKNQVDSGK